LAAAGYACYAGRTWLRYGHVVAPSDDERDPLLERLMPAYEIAERHHIRMVAPADLAYAALCDTDLQDSRIVRAIFRARELAMGAAADDATRPRGLLALTRSIGWGALAEIPGREVVMGAVTKPWDAVPVFRAIAPDAFASFAEPDYVKIVWTLRADPVDRSTSIARTETRVMTTDAEARRKFRRYWSLVSPGVQIIRLLSLRLARREAERRKQFP